MFGDLNEVIREIKKWESRTIWDKMLYLKQFIQQTKGANLGFSSNYFTWQKNKDGGAFSRQRLDNALANQSLIEANLKAEVLHLIMESFDHLLILILIDGMERI